MIIKSRDDSALNHVDEALVASWNLSDKPFIQHNYFKQISTLSLAYRKNHNADVKADRDALVEQFKTRLKRRYNDQTVYDFKAKNRYFEPEKVGFKKDRVLNDGMQRIAELVTQESDRTFTHFAAGIGNDDTYPNTSQLQQEVIRVDMTPPIAKGFFTASGTTINSAGYFDEAVPTFPVVEIGVVDGDGSDINSEVFLFRSVFPSTEVITHTFGQNFTTCIHTIYQRSV